MILFCKLCRPMIGLKFDKDMGTQQSCAKKKKQLTEEKNKGSENRQKGEGLFIIRKQEEHDEWMAVDMLYRGLEKLRFIFYFLISRKIEVYARGLP